MHTRKLVSVVFSITAIAGCAGANQKPFDQLTAQEHLAAAAQENQLANENFAKVRIKNIEPPETLPSLDTYIWAEGESGGAVPYTYDPGDYELGSPETYVAWPRVSDPGERYEDAASEHREMALRHERAAAALEGRPSPQPLPPEQPPLIPPDQA